MIDLTPGRIYGCARIVGPADPLRGRPRVRVACWCCKRERDVFIASISPTAPNRCFRCSQAAKAGARWLTDGAEPER